MTSANLLKAVLLCLGALLLAVAGWAQSTTTGAIGGAVSDPSGAIVTSAQVTVRNLGTNSTSSSNVDASGRFQITLLQPGQYQVEITAPGFQNYAVGGVIVEVGRTTALDVTLGLAGQKQTVEVTGEAPVITTDRSDMTMNINDASISNLPINGRRWSTFALGTPGAVPDGNFGLVSFRGISGLLNNNTVDGGDNNQAFFSEEKGRTRINYSISQASIQEFQVNTSNFSAEYGRSAGGVVNAVTKSGTNNFHGEAFWFDRDNGWGATNPFATMVPAPPAPSKPVPIKPKDKRHQFGGNIGGPILKDKLFFFFNYDQQKRNFPAVANASNPAAFFAPLSAAELTTLSGRGISSADANSALGFLQSLTGIVPRRGDQTLFFPKLDWKLSGNHHLTLEYNRMRWNSPAGIQTSAVIFRGKEAFGDDYVKDDTAIARLVSAFGSNQVNELRFRYGRDFEYEFTQPAVPGEPVSAQGISPQITIFGSAGIVFGKPNFLDRPAYPDETSYQVADTFSVSRGRHTLKAGADIVRFHDLMDNLYQESGAYGYNNRADFISDYVTKINALASPVCGTSPNFLPCYSSYNQGFGPPAFALSTVDYGFFVQDDWRFSPRLTLNFGLRWDFEKLPAPQIPNSALPATAKFPSDRDNFGPRVGFAWDLSGGGKTVLRGGYGIYYGRIINSTIANAITNTGMSSGQLQYTFLPATVGAPLYPNVAPLPPATTLRPDVVAFSDTMANPIIHQFDMVFERKLAANTAFSIGYIGSLGRSLPSFLDANLNSPAQTIKYTVSGGLDDGVSFTMPLFTGPRPNPAFGRITMISDTVTSKYNAFIFRLERRMSHGVQVQAFYTYAHSSDTGQSSQTFISPNNVLNVYALGLEQGRSNFDIRHRISVSGIWQPEFYHGSGSFVRALANGFTLAPLLSIASGAPFTGTVSGNAPLGTSTGILGAGGTSRPPFFPRNFFQMPRTINMDMRLAKKFKPRESLSLELFGEAFNIFNHVNVTDLGRTIYSISGTTLKYDTRFGVPTSSSNSLTAQRQLQIGVKLAF
ncbi:MAG: TonB-dependent receptor [Acidobacteriia bacterium]|nr:TonB-dependent receptor [Terriglobia bacterium]